MEQIDHEIKIAATPEAVFAALTTQDGLRGWYSPQVDGDGAPGHTWRFGFAGRPTFQWEVTESTAPTRVAWRCVEGPGDSVGTALGVDLSQSDSNRTLLELSHTGWPGTSGNYRKCNTYWGVLLHHLKQYAETGTPAPAFD